MSTRMVACVTIGIILIGALVASSKTPAQTMQIGRYAIVGALHPKGGEMVVGDPGNAVWVLDTATGVVSAYTTGGNPAVMVAIGPGPTMRR